MRSTCAALQLLASALGSYLAAALVSIVQVGSGGHKPLEMPHLRRIYFDGAGHVMQLASMQGCCADTVWQMRTHLPAGHAARLSPTMPTSRPALAGHQRRLVGARQRE